MNLRNDFDLDFMRFDPFQGREPWNEPDQEPEDRICELCDQVLATDEKEICEPCAQICAEDDAAHAAEDLAKERAPYGTNTDDKTTTTMNTYRTSEYSDRSPYRRKVDTVDRMDHLRKCVEHYGYQPRINRYAILLRGLDMLDQECAEATHQEVKAQLKDLFGGFDPMKALDNLTIRA